LNQLYQRDEAQLYGPVQKHLLELFSISFSQLSRLNPTSYWNSHLIVEADRGGRAV
jgi:hypothetical protein